MASSEVSPSIRALVAQQTSRIHDDHLFSDIGVTGIFSSTCQGGELIPCQVVSFIFVDAHVYVDEKAPTDAMVIDDPQLGKAVHILERGTREKVAEEMIDVLCGQAGCVPGRRCVKSR